MALEEATRSIAAQHDELDALRTRSVTLLSAGAVVFSLFTSQALSKSHLNLLTWAGLISFVVLAAATIWVLRLREFVFQNDVKDLIIEIDEDPRFDASRLADAQRDWAYWAWKNYDCNRAKIDGLMRWYTGGLAALTAEVVFLGTALLLPHSGAAHGARPAHIAPSSAAESAAPACSPIPGITWA